MKCKSCQRKIPDGSAFCNWCGKRQGDPLPRSPRKRGNGTGTAFKRGKTWTAQVTKYITTEEKDGVIRKVRRYQTKGGFSTKRDALEYIETLKAGQQRCVPTLLELYTIWEKTELPKLSRGKQNSYKHARQRLEPIIGRRVDSLTTADLQEIINDRAPTYYTARDMKVLLSHLYKRAAADQFVQANLSQFLVLPTLEESESTPFNSDEVDKMWEAFADGDTFIGYMLLMIYSGMMPGELFACKKDMIDFNRCEIYGCGKKTKTRKDSPIVFAECVRPVLEELLAASDGEKLQPLSESKWYRYYHNALKRIGVRDLPAYSCRHTTGTEAARQNLNASTIQKIMRHSQISTSQRYIHLGAAEAHTGLNSFHRNNEDSNPECD